MIKSYFEKFCRDHPQATMDDEVLRRINNGHGRPEPSGLTLFEELDYLQCELALAATHAERLRHTLRSLNERLRDQGDWVCPKCTSELGTTHAQTKRSTGR